jgi:hypothetical protein
MVRRHAFLFIEKTSKNVVIWEALTYIFFILFCVTSRRNLLTFSVYRSPNILVPSDPRFPFQTRGFPLLATVLPSSAIRGDKMQPKAAILF